MLAMGSALRICSLLPSATEIVYTLDQTQLERLAPNLILTQELCDVCAVSYALVENAVHRLPGQPTVLSLEPTSLRGILETIRRVGEAAGVPERAGTLVAGLERRIDRIAGLARTAQTRPSVFALEWLDPPFTAGHWIPEMIRLAGGRDDLAREGLPSSVIAWEGIVEYDPEIVVLMPCGFSAERTIDELPGVELPKGWDDLTAVRSGRVYAVDASAYCS